MNQQELLYGFNSVAITATLFLPIIKGIRPRAGVEKQKARLAMFVYIPGWLIALIFWCRSFSADVS